MNFYCSWIIFRNKQKRCCLLIYTRILLAKSPEHNLCGKIWSHYGAKLDENRTYTLTNSTIMYSIGLVCHLAVISPTVSLRLGRGTGSPDRALALAPTILVRQGSART